MPTELPPSMIALRAYEIFVPLLDAWRRGEHPEPSLAATVGNECAARILERDFRDIGLYLIGSDDRGTRIELGALVDCITGLRGYSTGERGPVDAAQLEKEFEMAKRRNSQSSFLPPPMALSMPLSLRVARDLQRRGTPVDAVGLKDLLVAFTHRLVLQDGNVTAHEIAVAREIEDSLTDMITNAV